MSLIPKIDQVRWGAQLDIRIVQAEERAKFAGYLAKYATKHSETAGGLDRPVKAADLALLPVHPHAHRLIVAAWLLSTRAPELGGHRWAHQFGFGGHFLTKSRRYSTTFTALRTARERHAARHRLNATADIDPWQRLAVTARHQLVGTWKVAGIGWRLDGDALLARTARKHARLAREAVREADASWPGSWQSPDDHEGKSHAEDRGAADR